MKVLLTCPTFPPRHNSGLGNAAHQQTLALARRGFSVTVATGGDRRAQRRDSSCGVVVEEFAVQGADSILQPLGGDVAGYVDFLTESAFDVILMNAWQTWSSDLILMNSDAIHGRKFLYSNCVSTNLILKKQPLRSVLRYLAWRPYWFRMPGRMRKLDGMVFVASEGCDSRFDDLRLARQLGIPHAFVPNAFSTECLQLAPSSEGSPERGQLIAVGSYDWFKGHDFVLRAYALSVAKNKVPLKFFGPTFTDFADKLRGLAANLGLDERLVTFHERTGKEELFAEYRRAKMLISGSHTECQPLVLLDAMAMGTPFVARSCGCIPSLEGGIGVGNERGAADAINLISNDATAWNALSQRGANAAIEQFHPEVVGHKLAAFLASKPIPRVTET